MDPTGPVFWLNYWPKKDPSLPDDPKFMELDQRLESILKMTAARFQDGNSNIELEVEAERTLESRALVNGRVGRRGNSL